MQILLYFLLFSVIIPTTKRGDKMENNKLILIIGEKPTNVPEVFSTIEMYYRKKDKSLEYYGTLNSMFNFDYVSPFFCISSDPRYYLEEGHTENGCRFRCQLKPVGNNKGLYRIIGGTSHKVATFEATTEIKPKRK